MKCVKAYQGRKPVIQKKGLDMAVVGQVPPLKLIVERYSKGLPLQISVRNDAVYDNYDVDALPDLDLVNDSLLDELNVREQLNRQMKLFSDAEMEKGPKETNEPESKSNEELKK